MRSFGAAAAALALTVACTHTPARTPARTSNDASAPRSTRTPAAPKPPSIASAALVTYQQSLLAPLTGKAEIRKGVTITNRFEADNKKETRDFISRALTADGLTPLRQTYATGENVYTILRSGRPNAETVVIGAHFDTVRVAPGANDDGTGTVAVLAVAREMAKVKGLTRDVIFVWFDEEERGLIGARNFAQWLKDTGVNVHSVHTIDQAGWDANKNRAIELELPYEGGEAFYTSVLAAMHLTIPTYVTTETGSDHNAFRRLGFKAIGITEEYRHKDTTPYYHKATDTYETVDFDYLASVTQILLRATFMLATGA